MTVAEFFSITSGTRQFSFSEEEKPLCVSDFWKKYRNTQEWNAEILHVKFIPCRKEENGLWYDNVICVITKNREKK